MFQVPRCRSWLCSLAKWSPSISTMKAGGLPILLTFEQDSLIMVTSVAVFLEEIGNSNDDTESFKDHLDLKDYKSNSFRSTKPFKTGIVAILYCHILPKWKPRSLRRSVAYIVSEGIMMIMMMESPCRVTGTLSLPQRMRRPHHWSITQPSRAWGSKPW